MPIPRKINQKVVVAIVYVSSMLLSTLDSTIVNIALATLADEFDVSPASIESVVIGYLVSLAVFITISGWMGDRFGTKRTFLAALALFIVASALCGLAQSLSQLVMFRILQGVGGGMLTPVGMAMLYRTFPPQERIGVGRIMMFATILGPALGPIIGGAIIEQASWRWIFFVNVPLGLAALVFGLLNLDEHTEPDPGPFDMTGFFLGGAGFALTMYMLSEGAHVGWSSMSIVISGLVGIALLVLFIFVELHKRNPMIQLRLLSNRLFGSTMLVSLCATAGFIGVLFLIPLFLQDVLGLSPLEAGLTVMPEAIGVVVATQIVARIYPHIGPRRLMAGGLFGVTVWMTLLSFIQMDTSLWFIRLLMFGIGAGMAFIFLPNQAASLATITSQETGHASTLRNVQRQLGGALGVAITGSVLSALGTVTMHADGTTEPNLTAWRAAFLTAAGLAFIGAISALRVPDADAANTMVRRETAPAAAD